MGEGLLQYYQTRLKKEYKIAFFSSFVISLLIHLYKFANTLPNHDSVFNYYSDQNVLGSGRWILSWACGISSYWDLPWINGLLSCVYIALTIVVITALFKIKNTILIFIIGALIAAAPSTTETFFFLFTADGYMLAMLLAALGVYLSRIDENRPYKWVLSGICICISCGIYQAYVSFALILATCYFIDILLRESYSKKECLKWVVRQAVIYIISLATYYVIWKLCMHFSGSVANDYQGISEVGNFSTKLLINGFFQAIKTTFLYFFQWDVFSHGFTLYNILNIIFLLIMALGLITAILKSKIYRRKWAILLLILCLIAIIPFACIWHFASDSVGYRAMMLQSLNLLFILTALLYEKWSKPLSKNVVALFLSLIVFHNALMANISYFYMNLCYDRTYADGIEMMEEIHNLQDEYDFDKIAVVGTRLSDVQWQNIESKAEKTPISGKIHILSSQLESSLLFDSEHTTRFLETTFGLSLEPLTFEQRNELLKTEEVQAMGCWPQRNSITVIGDTLVIKLSNSKEGT